MRVNEALGDKIVTLYRCRDFTWRMHGYSFTTEVSTLPLEHWDIVLGVQWLATLYPILWDFTHLKMEFKLNGGQYILRGTSTSSCKVIKGKKLNKLLLQEPQVAFLQLYDHDSSTDHEACLSILRLMNPLPLVIPHFRHCWSPMGTSLMNLHGYLLLGKASITRY